MESQCWKDKGIWYESCKEVTTPVNMMCWSCEVRLLHCRKAQFGNVSQADAAEKCYQKTSIKTISVPTKRCEPRWAECWCPVIMQSFQDGEFL